MEEKKTRTTQKNKKETEIKKNGKYKEKYMLKGYIKAKKALEKYLYFLHIPRGGNDHFQEAADIYLDQYKVEP
jgi:hypothetical protein